MKTYDYQNIRKYIQMHSDLIESAQLGMEEDWFWTAIPVYQDGKFLVDFDDDALLIAGIAGSTWATPTMEVTFKDGSEKTLPVFVGDSDRSGPPAWFSLGPLSGPCQDARSGKFIEG